MIPNFVELSEFNQELRSAEIRSQYCQPCEKLVGHMSNFRSVKRVRDVVRTFHLIQKTVPARLLMIGSGVELEPTRHLAAELGISDRVQYLGPIPKVGETLAQLDLFLLPSEYESFGLAALEAMACGVPIVATNTGGIPEVVEDGKNGILCEVGDYECMAAASTALLKDPARHAAMSVAARARAVKDFAEEQVVNEYESLYRELLED